MDFFVRDPQTYTRKYNIVKSYAENIARYISMQRNIPFEEAFDWVKQELRPGGSLAMNIPMAAILERGKNGDRTLVQKPFDQFLKDVRQSNEILTPSMTAYLNPDVKESKLGRVIQKNLKKRSAAKKEMQAAKMRGDELERSIKEGLQTSYKTNNNSLSGAQSSQGTPLWNKSAHSSLTSLCRTATSYGNACNERFLMGSRHYWCADIVKDNICSILNNTDFDRVKQVVERWQLKAPSVETVLEMIQESSKDYWRHMGEWQKIVKLVNRMDDLQRTAYLFTGDCYYLAQVNPEFFHTFLMRLCTLEAPPVTVEEADRAIKDMHANTLSLSSTICVKELGGGTLWDVDKKGTSLKEARLNDYLRFGAVTKNIDDTLEDYRDFIETFWLNDNFPASIFMMGSKVRKTVMLSDTDSTVFTTRHWTEWFTGSKKYSYESSVICAAMVYLTGQIIRHVLATISGNMGVHPKEVKRLSMKNEFTFPALALTGRAKHYVALISACEGNIYPELELEVKGVALRSAKAPPEIIRRSKELQERLLRYAMEDKQFVSTELFAEIAAIENEIKRDILAGSRKYMKRVSIKAEKTYKNPESSNYVHVGLWSDVFAPKYGTVMEPPYSSVKASINLDNPTQIKEWIRNIKDRALAGRLEKWIEKTGRKGLTMILVPEVIATERGIPEEIVQAIDIRGMIAEIMESFYITLEAMGIFVLNGKNSRLISDTDWTLPKQPA